MLRLYMALKFMFPSVVIISLLFLNNFCHRFVWFCYNTAIVLGFVASVVQWLISDEFGRIWKEVIVT
jgi:hypothetical protein